MQIMRVLFFYIFAWVVLLNPLKSVGLNTAFNKIALVAGKYEYVCDKNVVYIPLKRIGNLLLIDAKVDGIAGTFVFDTGAGGLVLNSTYFHEGKSTYDVEGSGITGTTIERKTKKIESFEIADITYSSIQADVIDLSHIENNKKIKILGLIGTAFIKDFEVIIDIKTLSLRLTVVDGNGEPLDKELDSYKYDIVHKINLLHNVILTDMTLGGKKVSVCLDTGAEQNIIDYKLPEKIKTNINIVRRTSIKGASDKGIEVLYGNLKNVYMDSCELGEMPVVVADLSNLRHGYGINISGMLGNGFLELGIIKMNFKKQVLSIAKYK